MSEPKDPLSFLMGWKAGNWVARQRGKVIKPDAPPLYIYGRAVAEGETPTVTVDGVGYKGIVIDKIPSYDEKALPYVAINYEGFSQSMQVFVSPSPITIVKGFGHTITIVSGMKMVEMLLEDSGREYWSEWQTPDSNDSYFTGQESIWSNHSINDQSGNLYVEAGAQPVPATLPEVLFDGEVNLYFKGEEPYPVCGWVKPTMSHFAVGDTARITFDGVVSEHIVRKLTNDIYWVIGNESLCDKSVEDDGGDWGIVLNQKLTSGDSPFNNGHPQLRCYHRNSGGLHKLKIERIAIADATA